LLPQRPSLGNEAGVVHLKRCPTPALSLQKFKVIEKLLKMSHTNLQIKNALKNKLKVV